MSEMYQRLAHSSWDCKYHVVFVPKRRRKVLFGQARRKLGEVFHALARQKECQIIAAGPCAHVYRDSSEVSGGLSDRISAEREERHSDGPLVWQRAEFHGRALLGPWIRSVHSGL
jgi:Transposase IS200 like